MITNVWEEFEKMAVDQGLIDNEENNDPKKSEKSNSLSDDAVSLLYGITPESIFDKKDIIEIAHPDTVIVAPAYDAMNAVIENVNQRQSIMAYIANKTPTGQATGTRYVAAKQDLIKSLVKAAFALEDNNEQLMNFADNCAVRLDQRAELFTKEAGSTKEAGAAAAILGGAASLAGALGPLGWAATALLGGIYYSMYSATSAQNVYANCELVLQALEPLYGKTYATSIKQDVSNLMNSVKNMQQINSALSKITSVNTVMDPKILESNKSKIENINKQREIYISHLEKVQNAIPVWVDQIKSSMVVSTEEGSSDWWHKLKSFVSPLMWTNEETLIDKLWGFSKILGSETLSEIGVSKKEGDGGLYQAIKNDIASLRKTVALAKQQVSSQEQQLKQQKEQELAKKQEELKKQQKPENFEIKTNEEPSVDFEPI